MKTAEKVLNFLIFLVLLAFVALSIYTCLDCYVLHPEAYAVQALPVWVFIGVDAFFFGSVIVVLLLIRFAVRSAIRRNETPIDRARAGMRR